MVRIVVDEFEKLRLKREKWNVRLELYYGFHEEMTEKKWWSDKLGIPMRCFTNPTWLEGIRGGKNITRTVAPAFKDHQQSSQLLLITPAKK